MLAPMFFNYMFYDVTALGICGLAGNKSRKGRKIGNRATARFSFFATVRAQSQLRSLQSYLPWRPLNQRSS